MACSKSSETVTNVTVKNLGVRPGLYPSTTPLGLCYSSMASVKERTFLQGPVNTTRRKKSLVNIAEELTRVLGLPGISTKASKDVHAEKILSFVEENAEAICADPHFVGLVAYRPGSAGTGRSAPGKKGARTSADKAGEDERESAKESTAPTGCITRSFRCTRCLYISSSANKKLLEQKITSDPPPQYEPLTATVLPQNMPSDGIIFAISSLQHKAYAYCIENRSKCLATPDETEKSSFAPSPPPNSKYEESKVKKPAAKEIEAPYTPKKNSSHLREAKDSEYLS